MPSQLRLEFDRLTVHKDKERWRLYFVVATEDPAKPGEFVVAVVPELPVRLLPASDNETDFGHSGLFVLQRAYPALGSLRTRIWLMHDRTAMRSAAEVTETLAELAGSTATTLAALSPALQWVSVGAKLLEVIANLVAETKDQDLGFLSLDEAFSADEIAAGQVPITSQATTKLYTLEYCWVIA